VGEPCEVSALADTVELHQKIEHVEDLEQAQQCDAPGAFEEHISGPFKADFIREFTLCPTALKSPGANASGEFESGLVRVIKR
jgi:hypothetical protein